MILVTNPVDILTRMITEASDLPPARVLGTSTMLDTTRLRLGLGRELRLDTHPVHAQAVGEHGDSGVVLWSGMRIGGVPLADWPGWEAERKPELGEEVRSAAYRIIACKGATNHAIGLVAADLLRCLLRDERRELTVSRAQEGACGLRDVALSLPAVVGATSADSILEPAMTQAERENLGRSADGLRRAYAEII